MELSKLSAANGTQQVQTQGNLSPRARKVLDEMVEARKNLYGEGKKVINEDVEKAMNEPSARNALIGLVKRSPLGFVQPKAEELCNNDYMVSMNGDRFSGPGGYGEWGNPAEDGSVNMTYKNGKFEQSMIYDQNGNAKSGMVVIRDDFGNIERQIDFIIQEGKMFLVQ